MRKFTFLILTLMVAGIQCVFASIDMSVLTFNAWKFNYSYKPTSSEVISRSSQDNYTIIKFNSDKSFVLVSEDKVESGLWEISTVNGNDNIKFNFSNSEVWGVKNIDKSVFVINNLIEGKSIEYYFSAATSEKDLRLFGVKLNAHIQEMENFYKSIAINNGFQNNSVINNTIEKIKELDGISSEVESKNYNQAELETQVSKVGFFKRIFGKSKESTSKEVAKTSTQLNVAIDEASSMESGIYESVSTEDANTVNIRNIKYSFKAHKSDYIEIYVSGGGLQAGINPKLRDQITFFNSGLVQKEYESKLGGKVSSQKKISRDELIELATFIMNEGFFSLQKEYACSGEDEMCKERILLGPKPIPLSIIIVVGEYRHNVSIPVYAPDIYSDIRNYPESITNILNTIYHYASI